MEGSEWLCHTLAPPISFQSFLNIFLLRDMKPANMLLDLQGHVHLSDFNVACVVKPGVPVTSVTGTKPYMGQS